MFQVGESYILYVILVSQLHPSHDWSVRIVTEEDTAHIMAGRRLLDAALVFSATRTVARHHFRIRGEQLDVWSKTSTLARTLGLRRVNAADLQPSQPPQHYNTVQTYRVDHSETVPSQDSVIPSAEGAQVREGLKQDHHYERSEQNATKEPVHEQELDIKQEKPANIPTPDGTLPPRDVPAETPSAEPVNADVAQQRTDAKPKQEIVSGGSSAKVEAIPEREAVPEQDQVPKGINTDVFHSPRIAKMLGGRTIDARRMSELRLREAAATSNQPKEYSNGGSAREPAVESVISSASAPVQSTATATEPIIHNSPTREELQDLAAELASDAPGKASPDAAAEVSL